MMIFNLTVKAQATPKKKPLLRQSGEGVKRIQRKQKSQNLKAINITQSLSSFFAFD